MQHTENYHLLNLSWAITSNGRPVTFDKAMGIVDQVADVIIPPIRTHVKQFKMKNGKRLTKSLPMPN